MLKQVHVVYAYMDIMLPLSAGSDGSSKVHRSKLTQCPTSSECTLCTRQRPYQYHSYINNILSRATLHPQPSLNPLSTHLPTLKHHHATPPHLPISPSTITEQLPLSQVTTQYPQTKPGAAISYGD
jgi:hypothetical protein